MMVVECSHDKNYNSANNKINTAPFYCRVFGSVDYRPIPSPGLTLAERRTPTLIVIEIICTRLPHFLNHAQFIVSKNLLFSVI